MPRRPTSSTRIKTVPTNVKISFKFSIETLSKVIAKCRLSHKTSVWIINDAHHCIRICADLYSVRQYILVRPATEMELRTQPYILAIYVNFTNHNAIVKMADDSLKFISVKLTKTWIITTYK